MRIDGHGPGDYLRLLAPLFALMAAVWALRIVVYAAGAAPMVLHIISVTLAGRIAILLAVIMIYRRRFGSYTSVIVSVFLLICWEQLIIAAAIVFTLATGILNVYSAPRFTLGESPATHLAGHLTVGIGSGTLLGAAMGCLLFWMLRRLASSAARSAR
ncbi:MAG TPA: hypothetical protein VG860_10610 [Terriglobia bacterium]|jgi:hypothetical protein|nr:hypothetical protein [Terriglobia bacterium]